MSLEYMGLPSRCKHGEYVDKVCDKCVIAQLMGGAQPADDDHKYCREQVQRQQKIIISQAAELQQLRTALRIASAYAITTDSDVDEIDRRIAFYMQHAAHILREVSQTAFAKQDE